MSRRIPEQRMSGEQRKLVEELLEDTRKKIDRDYKRAPSQLKPLLLHLKREIFNTQLTIGAACRESGVKSHRYSIKFCELTGLLPRDYVEHHRIMVAQRIIRHTPLRLWQVAAKVGYSDPSIFSRRYSYIVGHPPSKEESAKKGELPPADVDSEVPPRDSHALDPRLSPNTAELSTNAPRLDLRRFWDEIRGMNCIEIKRYLEHMKTIELDYFYYLLEKAKYEGRKDRARGQELGLAALDTLRQVEFRKGEDLLDEKAIAYASLAYTCTLRLDFEGARKWIRAAEKFLPCNPHENPILIARVKFSKASLMWHQRDTTAAIALLDEILPVVRQHGKYDLLARILANKGGIYHSTGQLDRAIPLLHEAIELSPFVGDLYVVFCAHFNLTLVYTKMLKGPEASAQFEHVKKLRRSLEGQVPPSQLLYLEGAVNKANGETRKAELFFLEAREGFTSQGMDIYTALVSLELALLYLELEKPDAAFAAAITAIPSISRFTAHHEVVAALAVLQEAAEVLSIDKSVVKKALHHLDLACTDPAAEILR